MLFGCYRRWICNSFHKFEKPKMDLTQLKAEWLDFAKRLYPIGMGIFGGTTLKVTEDESADIRILALMLLARTLSNLKAALALVESGFIVEAKTIAGAVLRIHIGSARSLRRETNSARRWCSTK